MDYTKASNAVADTIAKCGEPLTEMQKTVLAGSMAVFLEQMFRTSWNAAIENAANVADNQPIANSIAERIRNLKVEE